jgi:hypothetical protein
MSWKLISNKEREQRNLQFQIVGVNKITKFLNDLTSVFIEEKNMKLDLLKNYLLNYNYYYNSSYECNLGNKYGLINDFFNNIDTPEMYNKMLLMCKDVDISNAIISYMSFY